MSIESYIASQPSKRQKEMIDAMFGEPRKLFEVTFNAWGEMSPDKSQHIATRGVFFGVSAKTAEGARLKVLHFFEMPKGSFIVDVREQL